MARTHEELRSDFERHEAGHVFELLARFRLTRFLLRYPARAVWAGYVLVTCFVSIAVISSVAVVTENPFIFPSLGPTAYLVFFAPLARSSSPRHALLGHAIGIACGYMALLATGSGAAAAGLTRGVGWSPVLAAALSLSTTGAAMVLLRVSHAPAGATTLIVSLGLLTKPAHLLIIEAAVLFLVIEAFIINRLAGLPYPVWEERLPAEGPPR